MSFKQNRTNVLFCGGRSIHILHPFDLCTYVGVERELLCGCLTNISFTFIPKVNGI
jgi:hypothetical protein